MKYLMIDLFCGAGGTTTGALDSGVCKVIAAVNHDPLAIRSHEANHPECLHFQEDIRTLNLKELVAHAATERANHPEAKLILWASLECTNFSKAKGGRARDADSRTLAHHMPRYIKALNPDIFLIENVEEFMCWGDLDENGKPISRYEGCHYLAWVESIRAMGYGYAYRLLNAADFGAYTSRKRLFAAFSKPGIRIQFPEPTHSKNAASHSLFGAKPWRAVGEVLDLQDYGKSIFNRKKPLVDRTIRRITAGVKKFYHQKMVMTYTSPGYCKPITEPCSTLTTACHKAVLTPIIQQYYGNGVCHDVNKPLGTITTKDRSALIQPVQWLDHNYLNGGSGTSIEQPIGTLTTVPKGAICTAWLVNSQYQNKGGSIQVPAPTIIASQKSNPMYIAVAEYGTPVTTVCDTDTEAMCELKRLCVELGISDIFMRMLSIPELKRIQGFPADYVLLGKPEDQKKFIGNSVVPVVVAEWLKTLSLCSHSSPSSPAQ